VNAPCIRALVVASAGCARRALAEVWSWTSAANAPLILRYARRRHDDGAETGLHNRRETAEQLRAQGLRVCCYGEPAAAVVIDIDHFKANDVRSVIAP
jgi:GGDEF domain-containing protein